MNFINSIEGSMSRIAIALTTLIVLAPHAFGQIEAVKIPTRFGELRTNADGEFQFKGKSVVPIVSIPSAAYVVSSFKLESSDVVLVSQASGTACPGQFVFVTVAAEGAKASPTFGTCYDDDVKLTQVGQTIAFSMRNLKGKGSTRYIYERGVVFEDGKPVK